jgi:hypothetical protein
MVPRNKLDRSADESDLSLNDLWDLTFYRIALKKYYNELGYGDVPPELEQYFDVARGHLIRYAVASIMRADNLTRLIGNRWYMKKQISKGRQKYKNYWTPFIVELLEKHILAGRAVWKGMNKAVTARWIMEQLTALFPPMIQSCRLRNLL